MTHMNAYLKTLFFAAVTMAAASGAHAGDPVEGIWKTQVDDGAYAYVKMAPCGASLCGVIARTFKSEGEYKSENIGKNLVWDMVKTGDAAYGNGRIWQPSTGKEYKSKMVLEGDILKVSGCFGPICKKQTWSRVK